MSETNQNPQRPVAEILRDIDSALPLLPQEQQNRVAAFAQGLKIGLSLHVQTHPQPQPPPKRG